MSIYLIILKILEILGRKNILTETKDDRQIDIRYNSSFVNSITS